MLIILPLGYVCVFRAWKSCASHFISPCWGDCLLLLLLLLFRWEATILQQLKVHQQIICWPKMIPFNSFPSPFLTCIHDEPTRVSLAEPGLCKSNISLSFLGGWCCHSKETCDSRYQNTPRLMSSSGWAQTKRGRSVGHILKWMSYMFPPVVYLILSKAKGHLCDLWLLDLQELEYCLLRQRKTRTGIMQILCKYMCTLSVRVCVTCWQSSLVNDCETWTFPHNEKVNMLLCKH